MSQVSESEIEKAGFVKSDKFGWNHPSVPKCTECQQEGTECAWYYPTKNASHPGALDLPPHCLRCYTLSHLIDGPCSTAQRLEYIGMPDEKHSEPYFVMRDGRQLGLADRDQWHVDASDVSGPDLPLASPSQSVSESRPNPVTSESEHASLVEHIQHSSLDPSSEAGEPTTGLLKVLSSDGKVQDAPPLKGQRVKKSAKEAVGQVQKDERVLRGLQGKAKLWGKKVVGGSVTPAKLSEAELVKLLNDGRRRGVRSTCLTQVESGQQTTIAEQQKTMAKQRKTLAEQQKTIATQLENFEQVRKERDDVQKERDEIASMRDGPGEVDPALLAVIQHFNEAAEAARNKATKLEESAEYLSEYRARQQKKRKAGSEA